MISPSFVSDVITTVINAHPKDCIFISDLHNHVLSVINLNTSKDDLIEQLYKAIKNAEIY